MTIPAPSSMPSNLSTPSKEHVRPSGWWYLLVPLLFLAGIGVGVAGAIDEGTAVADSFAELGSDGRGTIDLGAGDEATVMAFWEDGRSTDSISRPESTVVVTPPGGGEVEFQGADSEMTFDIGSRSGINLGEFTASEDGAHEVEVTFGDPDVQAAVGRLDWRSILGRVLTPVGLGAAASIGLWILLIVLRSASKRRGQEQPQFQGTAPYSSGPGASKGPFV